MSDSLNAHRMKTFASSIAFVAAFFAATSAQAQTSQIIPLPLQHVIPAANRSCDQTTASGLGYSELKAGAGAKPVANDFVLIDYLGYLAADGVVFDQGQKAPLGLGNVIPGFAEGVRLMPVGSVYRLCLPAALGYGDAAQGPIPAGSALVFQIELFDKRSLAEIQAAQPPEQPPLPQP